MKFFTFDADYLRRLRDKDPDIEGHFARYFGELLALKLRSRLPSQSAVEDVRQETLMRALDHVHRGALQHPERLGAFVVAISENVLREFRRREHRTISADAGKDDWPDERINLDRPLVTAELVRRVQTVLEEISDRDRRLLRAIFLEERDKDEVCREYQVDPDYLRVLLHRAKARFRRAYQKGAGSGEESTG